jgi:hypothetical protein
MHLNYHFLRFLCPALESELKGKIIVSCFSQNKDELIIEFEDSTTSYFLRANLLPGISCLSLESNFKRGKRNTVSLFAPAVGQTVAEIKVCSYERGFKIYLNSGAVILFKLHGAKSNILWYPPVQNLPELLFRNQLKEDFGLNLNSTDLHLDLSRERFLELSGNASQFLPTLGKIPREWLKAREYPEADVEQKWQLIQELLDMLESPLYGIQKESENYELTLLPADNLLFQTADPIAATNELFRYLVVVRTFEKEKAKWVRHFEEQLKKTASYLVKTKEKLEDLELEPPLSQQADVIMANLHHIPKGAAEASLFNFYTNQEVTIKFKQGQSPQLYAENLYRKSKNRKLEISQLQQNIHIKQLQEAQYKQWLDTVYELQNYKSLKSFLKTNNLGQTGSNQEEQVPFKKFEFGGFEILVGKSSKANDELLRKYAWKEDLWLHAKDVSGSHVLIKFRSGMIFPGDVLERAAELAAFYSKSKNDTLASVIYTPVKYVRKVKGAAPGAVMVDKEKVILVPPRGPQQANEA